MEIDFPWSLCCLCHFEWGIRVCVSNSASQRVIGRGKYIIQCNLGTEHSCLDLRNGLRNRCCKKSFFTFAIIFHKNRGKIFQRLLVWEDPSHYLLLPVTLFWHKVPCVVIWIMKCVTARCLWGHGEFCHVCWCRRGPSSLHRGTSNTGVPVPQTIQSFYFLLNKP